MQTDHLSKRHVRRYAALCALLLTASVCHGHVFVSGASRAGAFPAYDGSGWIADVYLNLPGSAALNLITAESYANNVEPDFTFKTAWIDFPAGPQAFARDFDLHTVGDFFNDYIYDVSDSSKLDDPMSSMFVRFHGLIRIVLADEDREGRGPIPPIWIDIGTQGYDGFRVKIVNTIYRVPDVNPDGVSWYQFGPEAESQGLYPIEISYLNRYDPFNVLAAPNGGIEVYSWHGSEKAYPAGEQMIHPVLGPGTILPPRVIYQPEDALPLGPGDFDGDGNIDLRDWQWAQICFNPTAPPFIYLVGCGTLDFDVNGVVDEGDVTAFNQAFAGPEPVTEPRP